MFGRSFTPFSILSSMLPVCLLCSGQEAKTSAQSTVPIHLQVDAGSPIRIYVTERVPYRDGTPVHAKLAEPVWSFDRIVIPQGTSFEGQVTELVPASKMTRAMAMLRGDFTPLSHARVAFEWMTLPDGKSIALDTAPSFGLNSIYVPPRPQKAPAKKKKADGKWTAFAKQQAQMQANARTRGLLDFVRTQNRREWIEDFLWSKLPYHPQRYRSGTRFDAVLEKPLDFGEVAISTQEMATLGTSPASDSPAQVRFLSTVSSANAHIGDSVSGVLSQPLFAANHELVLPQGTRLSGKVTQTRAARLFHRGGQLRFAFDQLDLSAFTFAPAEHERTQAQLTAAEQVSGSLKVDSEGTAKATESKTRFLRPVIAGLVAAKSMDNDAGKQQTAAGGGSSNTGGLALGGFSGFGLFGTAAAYGPRIVGETLGWYGFGWSEFQTVFDRGREVTFDKNAVMAIRFGEVGGRQLNAKR
jgi:hypothetical protein